jgi:hypothetical protein
MIPYENGSDSLVDDCAAAIPGLDWRTRSNPGDGTGVADGTTYIADDHPPFSDRWDAVWRSVSVERQGMCGEDRRELNLMYYYYVTVSVEFSPAVDYFHSGESARPEGYGLGVERADLVVSVTVYGHTIESAYICAVERISAMLSAGLPTFASRDDLRKCGL